MPDKYGRMTDAEKQAQQKKNADWQKRNAEAVANEKKAGVSNTPKPAEFNTLQDVLKNPGEAIKQGMAGLKDSTERATQKATEDRAGLEKAKAEQQQRHEAMKGMHPSHTTDLEPTPGRQAGEAQEMNQGQRTADEWRRMGEDPNDHPDQVYDPGDTDGNGVTVSPEAGNMKWGNTKPEQKQDEDEFAKTKAAWKHLTDVFGDKVSALQSELEGRLEKELTPTDRETGNPYAGDDVPESKEMNIDDVKSTLDQTKNDSKAVAGGLKDIGEAALDTGSAAIGDAGNAMIKRSGLDVNALKNTGKTLAGLSGLFSSSDDGNDNVPDSNWKPKSINDLFNM